jgi:hypothetical protein
MIAGGSSQSKNPKQRVGGLQKKAANVVVCRSKGSEG